MKNINLSNVTDFQLIEIVRAINWENDELSFLSIENNDMGTIQEIWNLPKFLELIEDEHYSIHDEYIFFDNDKGHSIQSINGRELSNILREKIEKINNALEYTIKDNPSFINYVYDILDFSLETEEICKEDIFNELAKNNSNIFDYLPQDEVMDLCKQYAYWYNEKEEFFENYTLYDLVNTLIFDFERDNNIKI